MPFRHRSHLLHLLRMQQRAGGGFSGVLTLFGPPPLRMQQLEVGFYSVSMPFVSPPPSHATASRRWFLWCFDAICATTPPFAYKSKPKVGFLGRFESHED